LRFIDDCFPLIVAISDEKFDTSEVRALSEGFERYFERGERYAVLVATPRHAAPPNHLERKMISEWAHHPRVRDFSKRLCVGTAAIVTSALTRAAFSVIMAFGKPASPIEAVTSLDQGLDYCLRRIQEERLPTSKPNDLVRYEIVRALGRIV
jgi:hypothetical protein